MAPKVRKRRRLHHLFGVLFPVAVSAVSVELDEDGALEIDDNRILESTTSFVEEKRRIFSAAAESGEGTGLLTAEEYSQILVRKSAVRIIEFLKNHS